MGTKANIVMIGFLLLILLGGGFLGINYFIFPSMYKDYIEKQGLPVYPNSKIRIAELNAKAHAPLSMEAGNFLTFFNKDKKDIGFYLDVRGSYFEISKFYKEKLKNSPKFKFKEGISEDKTEAGIYMKVGEKIMIQIDCDYKCDSNSGSNHIQIRIPDPAGNFTSDMLDLWQF
ncbi:MAG: hypothetical protein R3B95_08040 [Nitrospirales bacterium]|nr:hypothetical protein [Nitrospirales bacterium]